MHEDQLKDGNRRLRSSYASSIISISLVLFMTGLLGLLVLDARKISDYIRENVQLNVFLTDDVTEKERNEFRKEIEKQPYTRAVRYVSKEEALDSLLKDLGESALGMIESNPLPETFDVSLRSEYAHPDTLVAIKAALSRHKAVREVAYQQNEIETMYRNFRTIAIVLFLFSCLLLFIAIVLINNTIRISLYSRRFIIKSMQLVGATRGFIRWPFLRRSFLHGAYAGIISCLLLSGIIYLIQINFPEFGQLSDPEMIGILFGTVVLFGIILSGISTFLAINRYLRMRIDELYY